jgi:hypothetical protein
VGDVALAGWLAGRRALLCYGLMGDAVARLGLDYMDAHAEWLAAQGARVEVLRVPTSNAIEANGAVLREALVAEEAGALVVAHSKGGVDALAGLVHPDAMARCAAFLAFQSPFLGTPVADVSVEAAPLMGIAKIALPLLGSGDAAGIHDLTTAAREAWMAAHAEAVAELTRRVRVVTIGTDFTPRLRLGRDTHLAPLALWLRERAGPNDGLVPVASALLPGARHLVESGSHVALIIRAADHAPEAALERALRAALAD